MLRPTGGMVGWECYALPAAEGWKYNALPAAEGWECSALPAAGWDGIATSYRRQGGMGMLRPTGGRVGWDCYALPAA